VERDHTRVERDHTQQKRFPNCENLHIIVEVCIILIGRNNYSHHGSKWFMLHLQVDQFFKAKNDEL